MESINQHQLLHTIISVPAAPLKLVKEQGVQLNFVWFTSLRPFSSALTLAQTEAQESMLQTEGILIFLTRII